MIAYLKKVGAGLAELLDLWLTAERFQGASSVKVYSQGARLRFGGPETKKNQLKGREAPRGQVYNTLIVLSAVRAPLWVLWILKVKGVRIVVNQNGVYFPRWWPRGWRARNRYLKRLNALADRTVFQSAFAWESYRQWVGSSPRGSEICHNGVDLKRFHPRDLASHSDIVRVLVFLDVHAHSRELWRHLIQVWIAIAQKPIAQRLSWRLMGRIGDEPIDVDLAREIEQSAGDALGERVEYCWNPGGNELPLKLREMDLALHLVHNDVCPNKVLECVASGVHVIVGSAGGARELIGEAGQVLDVAAGYDSVSYPDSEAILRAIEIYEEARDVWRTKALLRAKEFDLERWLERMVR